jgi:4-amino-4-deoxy-L-arabinose transferase-like glycosyltransferase
MISALALQLTSGRKPLAQTEKLTRSEWLLLLGAVCCALLLRLSLLPFQFQLTPDGVFYAALAKNLAQGNLAQGLSTYWSPLYPLLVGGASLIFSDIELSGRIVAALAGSLIVIPSYLLAREFYGKVVAAIAAFLLLIHPPLVQYSTLVLTESTYTLLFISFVLAGWYALARGSARDSLLAGLFLGACYLVKPEAIAFFGLLIVLLLCRNYVFAPQPYARVLKNMLLLALGLLLLAAPYLWFLRQETGRWTVSEKFGLNFSVMHQNGNPWFRLDESGSSTLADRLWAGDKHGGRQSKTSEALTAQRPNPSTLFWRMIKRLNLQYELHLPQLFSPLLFAFAAAGLFRHKWSKQRARQEAYLLLMIFSTLLGYALVVAEIRYLQPLIPIILIWVAQGVVAVESWLLQSSARLKNVGDRLAAHRLLLRTAIVALLAISMLPWGASLLFGGLERKYSFERKLAGEWIKTQASRPTLVMSPTPEVAFFAQGEHVFLPDEDYDVVIAYARRRHVKYLVIDENSTQTLPRWKRFLFEPSLAPAFKRVYLNPAYLDFRIAVFELDYSSPSLQPQLSRKD